jgi:hypothetical protein
MPTRFFSRKKSVNTLKNNFLNLQNNRPMNRTITPEETRQLFEFCEKKRVKHYDVQFELVDHLASDIEEQ